MAPVSRNALKSGSFTDSCSEPFSHWIKSQESSENDTGLRVTARNLGTARVFPIWLAPAYLPSALAVYLCHTAGSVNIFTKTPPTTERA